MAKIYSDELEAAMSFTTFDTLNQDSTDATSTGDKLVDFIEQSGAELSGEQWETVRAKMTEFQTALASRATVANHLGEAIQEALKKLKDYMAPYEMLDSSRLDEYKAARDECEASIETLQGMLGEMKQVSYPDPNNEGEYINEWVHVYDVDAVNAEIEAAKATLEELDRIIAKVEGLDAVYEEAEVMLEEAYQEVLQFQQQVSSITPSSKYVYQR